MKYLCLIYQEEARLDTLSTCEWNSLMEEFQAFIQQLNAAERYLAGNMLTPTHTATSLRLRAGKVLMTDGPFDETKEQLVGYCLITAKDFNEAIQIASQMPSLRYGSLEVRPVRDLEK